MRRRSMNQVFSICAAVMFLFSVFALSAPAKDTKAGVSATMTLMGPTSLNGKELKAGDYSVSADETQVKIYLHGKEVATAPVQWKDEPSKARYSAFVTNGNKVTEIHFGGKTKYVTIAE
jgi:hypothetical protein